eukprot:10919710-Alexandrium_andersonii.AAC.1
MSSELSWDCMEPSAVSSGCVSKTSNLATLKFGKYFLFLFMDKLCSRSPFWLSKSMSWKSTK